LNIKASIYRYGTSVVLIHVLGICLLAISMMHHPGLMGLGFLAYTFGLRHAFDADHIAAIDNTVRKLRQENVNSVGVGFYFSLGHSTIVFFMAVAASFAMQWANRFVPELQNIGQFVGTLISAVFLFVIGLINLFVLLNLFQMFKRMRKCSFREDQFEELLLSRGFLAKLIGPLFKLINRSWHIYPVGLLFGFSFDTASEIALLAISAGAAERDVPLAGIIAIPILFSAGMALMDTADGIFMVTAYNWAFSTPVRKVYYNLTVTGMSVGAALGICIVEVAQVLTFRLGLTNGFWSYLQNINFEIIGYLLVGIFVLTWMLSYGVWKFFRIEQRWSSSNL
jgi:nickel/cobalt transporter (NiCoT) family protein